MKTSFKKLSDTRVEVTVTLDAKDLKPAEEKALEKLAKEIKVQGFRQGKVPADVARKFIPDNDLAAEARDLAVRSTVIEAFRKENKMPLAITGVNVTKEVPGETLEYTATADIIPEVKLGDYKKLGVKQDEVKVAAADIDAVLSDIAERGAEKKVVKRAAAKGDEVIIDFVGKKDGEAFAGGSAKDYHLTLGSGAFIPGFEDGIVGHEAGDSFDLKLTFPKDYGMKDLAGAKTVFEVLVKQVNEIVKPKIDDKFVKDFTPFDTLKEAKEDIKKNLIAQAEYRAKEKFQNELLEALVKKSKVAAPEALIEDQLRAIREDVTRNAMTNGMDFDSYIARAGETLESWEKEARKIAENRVKSSLALQSLAVQEKIDVPEAEVNAKIAELRDVYKNAPDAIKQLKDPNVKMDIKNRMVIEKSLDFLVDKNKTSKK